jgi:hypothetical protein
VQVPRTFLGAEARIPEQGRFFIVQPENLEVFWDQNRRESLAFFGGAHRFQ